MQYPKNEVSQDTIFVQSGSQFTNPCDILS